jgi:hypothetical protein
MQACRQAGRQRAWSQREPQAQRDQIVMNQGSIPSLWWYPAKSILSKCGQSIPQRVSSQQQPSIPRPRGRHCPCQPPPTTTTTTTTRRPRRPLLQAHTPGVEHRQLGLKPFSPLQNLDSAWPCSPHSPSNPSFGHHSAPSPTPTHLGESPRNDLATSGRGPPDGP